MSTVCPVGIDFGNVYTVMSAFQEREGALEVNNAYCQGQKRFQLPIVLLYCVNKG